ncbi:MAG: VCBS repeat-containing protein [candidate division Zixibacteria bacterium]|nr:VCBS repeat-containing protein [candidate division Zixibacteria bacterium]
MHRHRLTWSCAALLCVVLLGRPGSSSGQGLTQTAPGLPHVRASAAAWGDVDSDGDLDLALSGLDGTGQAFTKIYKNTAGTLEEDNTHEITGILWGDLAFGDFDNDGRPDLAISGQGQSGNAVFGVSEVYRNVNGVLTKDPAQLLGQPPFFEVKLLRYGSVAWIDFTNDGKLDLAIAGIDRNGFVSTKLYVNQNNLLTENSAQSVVAIRNGAVSWGDFNGDGLPDLAIMGLNDQGLRTTNVYINNDGLLIESSDIDLPAVYGGDLAWGDYNGDGNLDLALSGWDEHWNALLRIYRNNPLRGTLEEAFSLTTGGSGLVGNLAWGDYDADGDLDLAVAGRNEFTSLSTEIFENNGTSFTPIIDPTLNGDLDLAVAGRNEFTSLSKEIFENNGTSFTPISDPTLIGVMNGTLTWVDVNGDARLDLMVTGEKDDGTLLTTLYSNSLAANVAPSAPVLGKPVVTSTGIVFRWKEGTDATRKAASLTYNLRVGTTSRGNELVSASVVGAGPGQGDGPGNVGQTLIKQFNVPVSIDSLFWSVQTVDAGFRRSAFAAEDTIVIQRLVNSKQQLVGVRQTILGQGAAWGDYDADGFIDLIIAGRDINGDAKTFLYRNQDGTLVQQNTTLDGLLNGGLAWADYDRDGDLDLFRSGEDRFNNGFTFLYRNNGGVFRSDSIQTHIGNLNLRQGGAAWGDYNNDGRIDLAVSGLSRTGLRTTAIYKNVPGDTLRPDASQTITGTANGQLAWGDIDNDGDLDLVISGESGTPSEFIPVLYIYRNTRGILTRDTAQNLPGFFSSSLALGDVNNDGDLDIVVTGGIVLSNTTIPTALVLANNGTGTFSQTQSLRGTFGGAVSLGDIDNDGDLDLFLSGQDSNSDQIALLYVNNAGTFTETSLAVVPGTVFSSAAWADYDNDRDLDLALTGGTYITFVEISRVFDNLTAQSKPNALPNAPALLTAKSKNNTVQLSWTDGSDSETSAAGLTYLLRIGTSPGAHNIVSGKHAPGIGPLGHANADTLYGLADSTYFWSIRSIDAAYGASSEAIEQQFVIDTTPPTVSSVTVDPPVAGIGAVVTVVLNFAEKVGVNNSVNPTIVFAPKHGGTSVTVDKLSFSGNIWTGKVTISATTVSDTMLIGVSGVQDLQGNVSVSVSNAGFFIVDTAIPAVVSTFPAAGQKGVISSASIKATFSKGINAASLTGDTFKMRRTDNGASVNGSVSYDVPTRTVQFVPAGRLEAEKDYEATLGAAITDSVGNRLTADYRWTFTTATQVSKLEGGRLTTPTISLYIPPNALDEGAEVSLEEVNVDSLLRVTTRPVNAKNTQALKFVGPAIRLTPETQVLPANKPGTLTMDYSNQPLGSVNEDKLAIFRESSPGTWERVGGTLNKESNKIVTSIGRLGIYAVFEDAAPADLSAAFSFRAQPRVFSPGGQRFNATDTSISFSLNKSTEVTVEVYNIAGRLERVLCANKVMGPGTMVEFWDGKDEKGRLCSSGLYVVLIEAGSQQEKVTVSVLND